VCEAGLDTVFGSQAIRNRKVKKEGWVNLYRLPDGDILPGSALHQTEEEAIKGAKKRAYRITAAKLEWEE
jgi:hypothetical protein